MKVNLTATIQQLDGTPLMQPPVGDAPAKPWTLRDVIVTVCMNELGDKQEPGTAKLERFLLAQRVYNAEREVDLTAEQVAMVKDRIGRGFGAALVGPAFLLLDA